MRQVLRLRWSCLIATLISASNWCAVVTEEIVEVDENSSSDNEWLSKEEGEFLANLTLVIHRNTEAEECGRSSSTNGLSVVNAMEVVKESSELHDFGKYNFESLLSTSLGVLLLQSDSCSGNNEELMSGLVSYCDMGDSKTPKLPDHESLVPIMLPPGSKSLPCHFHTREGLRLTSLKMLIDATKNAQEKQVAQCEEDNEEEENTCMMDDTTTELHLYAVPAGRVFMFAPAYVGEMFDLSHIPTEVPLKLEVLSLSPVLFEIYDFFSHKEGDILIDHILNEEDENMKLKRSSTGATGYTVNSQRTSEGGFDTTSPIAVELKKRCFELLGFDAYDETFADGLQILRYNQTGGYIDHEDYLDDPSDTEEHNYKSAGIGTNRFATVLLYFNDIPEDSGGETVFTQVWPPTQAENDHVPLDRAIEQFRETPYAEQIKEGSWEERLSAQCKTKLAITPKATRAVLFYSQKADGSLDTLSKHGGCPVLNGTKWAANLWVWSGPMNGPHAPVDHENVENNMRAGRPTAHPQAVTAIFRNVNRLPEFDEAELYFGEDFWGSLGKDSEQVNINSFYGHKWEVYVGEELVKTFDVGYGTPKYFDL